MCVCQFNIMDNVTWRGYLDKGNIGVVNRAVKRGLSIWKAPPRYFIFLFRLLNTLRFFFSSKWYAYSRYRDKVNKYYFEGTF